MIEQQSIFDKIEDILQQDMSDEKFYDNQEFLINQYKFMLEKIFKRYNKFPKVISFYVEKIIEQYDLVLNNYEQKYDKYYDNMYNQFVEILKDRFVDSMNLEEEEEF